MERVENMPHRVVCTKTIKDERLNAKQMLAGTVVDLDDYQYNLLMQVAGESITEIEMSREDWIDLATNNFNESLEQFNALSEEERYGFDERCFAWAPEKGEKVTVGDAGLKDIYYKSRVAKEDIKRHIQKLSKAREKDTHTDIER